MKIFIETDRLSMREWSREDLAPFSAMNADERVMEYFLKPLTENESHELFDKIVEEISNKGFGIFAVESKENCQFIGFVGLHQVTFVSDFTPAIEIAWRLIPTSWGRGYATEAAKACLDYAKEKLDLKEIIAFTSLLNKRSERVMQSIGMVFVKEFDHPLVEVNHPLLRHVLYKKELSI